MARHEGLRGHIMEALHSSLTKPTNEVEVSVVHAAVGGITSSDVLLACTPGQGCRP